MFPVAFQTPAAIVLVGGGLLACFLGFRLFRLVLGIYGFILGALLATSLVGPLEPLRTVLVAIGGGLVGALVLILAYFVGVALVGAGLGALLVHLIWSQLGGEPHPIVIIFVSIAGALGALALQRYVIIVGTSLGGAWTTVVGALSLTGARSTAEAVEATGVWLVYPLQPAPGEPWVAVAWLLLAVLGVFTQLATTGATGTRRKRKRAA